MSAPLPVSAFPLSGKAAKSGGFVLAVLVGLALYLGQQKNQSQPNA